MLYDKFYDNPNRCDMNKRSGYSLIELMTAITIGSVVVVAVVGLLHLLIQIETDSRTRLGQQEIRAQLAKQFRRDVHAANRLTSLPEQESKTVAWRLQLEAQRSVDYRLEGNTLARIERSGDKTVRGDSFSLPPGAPVTIEPSTDAESPGIVQLRIGPVTDSSKKPARAILIEAGLGIDHRFHRKEEP